MDRFPRGRVLWRAWRLGSQPVAGEIGVIALAVILGVALGVLAQRAGAPVGVASAIGGAGGVLGATVLLTSWNLAQYRLSGRKDKDWETRGTIGDDTLHLELTRRTIHASRGDLGLIECCVRGPDGQVDTLTIGNMLPMINQGVLCRYIRYQGPGSYEWRWYATHNKRRFCEVTRGSIPWT